MRPAARERMRAYDFTAMLAAAQDRESLETVLPEIRVPCLLFAGADDEVRGLAERAAAQIQNAKLVSLPDLSHAEVMARSDLVAPMVRDSSVTPSSSSTSQGDESSPRLVRSAS